ncbi:MAG: tetratricopeptide repeat protein, partial [Chlamydiales bacterium]|nr:tetratricopeptide repeat protein [Chlamydiales bacterium]
HALSFLHENRLDEAKASFSFLTKINPFASDFWIGLGVAHLLNEDYTPAFDAFIMALTMEPDRYECYAYAIECCTQMKNYSQAEALLRQAVAYAKRHPSHEQSYIILEEAPRIDREIQVEKSIHIKS